METTALAGSKYPSGEFAPLPYNTWGYRNSKSVMFLTAKDNQKQEVSNLAKLLSSGTGSEAENV